MQELRPGLGGGLYTPSFHQQESTSLQICTSNLGKQIYDSERGYVIWDCARLMTHLGEKPDGLDPLSKEAQKTILTMKNTAEVRFADFLLRRTNPIHIFFLQEIGTEKRPLIEALKKSGLYGYLFSYDSKGRPREAVFYLKSRFSNHVIPLLPHAQDRSWAGVRLWDECLGRSVAAVSLHAPGYPITNALPTPEQTQPGVDYLSSILSNCSEFQNANLKLLGGDFNCLPNHPLIEAARAMGGFHLFNVNRPTNVNPESEVQQLRELDFFMVNACDRLSFSDTTPFELQYFARPRNPVLFSDHLPVFGSITVYFSDPQNNFYLNPGPFA